MRRIVAPVESMSLRQRSPSVRCTDEMSKRASLLRDEDILLSRDRDFTSRQPADAPDRTETPGGGPAKLALSRPTNPQLSREDFSPLLRREAILIQVWAGLFDSGFDSFLLESCTKLRSPTASATHWLQTTDGAQLPAPDTPLPCRPYRAVQGSRNVRGFCRPRWLLPLYRTRTHAGAHTSEGGQGRWSPRLERGRYRAAG